MSKIIIQSPARFKFRSDTTENWILNNPVLLSGEIAITTDGDITEKIKIGDGHTPWTELLYYGNISSEFSEMLQEIKQIAQSVRDDADAGVFNGEKGEKGDKGDKGDKGEDYVLTETDKEEIAEIVKPEITQELSTQKISFSDGATIAIQDNTEYTASEEITSLTVVYPETEFICSFNFTLASAGSITITLPESKYIGGTPSFENGETWELNIKNGVVVGGLVE